MKNGVPYLIGFNAKGKWVDEPIDKPKGKPESPAASLTTVIFSGFYHTKPVGQGRSRSTASGHHYTPAKTRKAQTDLGRWFYLGMDCLYSPKIPPPETKPIVLSLKFGFTKPKTNKKPYHTQKPDLSNLIKLVEDAGNGILWIDDSQIIQLNCEKFWSEAEGIEITVEVVN